MNIESIFVLIQNRIERYSLKILNNGRKFVLCRLKNYLVITDPSVTYEKSYLLRLNVV